MMEGVINLIQSTSILLWGILVIMLYRRVNRLRNRMDRLDYRVDHKETPAIQDPQPICGCGHHQCFHDETSCSKIENWRHWGSDEVAARPCGCKRYTGPEPLPTIIP